VLAKSSGWLAGTITIDGGRNPMGDAMLKHLSICAVLTAFGTGSLSAQQEGMLQKVAVPGADFEIVFAMPKHPAGGLYDLGETPDALVMHLIGGALVVGFDAPEKMIAALEYLRSPACTFRMKGSANPPQPVAVFVVPKRETSVRFRTASSNAHQPEPVMRKVDVPGADLDVIFAMTKSPAGATTDLGNQPSSLFVYSVVSELAMAVEGDVEKMFKEVGSSQLPICAFEVEYNGGKPPKVASVYIVPKGDTLTSSQ
jgi:hypothetical protein